MNRSIGLSFLVAGVLGCQSPLSPDELRRLVAAEQRWALRGFANYSIETLSSCFCPPELSTWVRIEVIDGQVSRAVLLSTGEIITDPRLRYWRTVEALFETISNANHDDGLSDIEVTFDPTLGFPSFMNWIPEKALLDAGGSQSLRDAQPLP